MQLLEFFLPTVLAHETGEPHVEPVVETVKKLDQLVSEGSLQTVYVAAIALGLLLLVAILLRNPAESAKRVLFWSIASITIISTGLLVGMTIYLNHTSVTKGPVHWHADFEIWACGVKQDLLDPTGLSNKIGSPTLHEHDDLRIHVEGVVVEYPDVNLGAFFETIGGGLTGQSLTFPTNAGHESFTNGQSCPGSTETAELQVFAVTADLQNRTYSQHKLTDPAAYRFAQHSQVPPGDCLILEFAEPKNRTDKLCQSYQVAKVTGELTIEVPYQEDDGN
ncbi:MAG: hypothetical protein WEC83_01025 [Patescibacteria group bacterium]